MTPQIGDWLPELLLELFILSHYQLADAVIVSSPWPLGPVSRWRSRIEKVESLLRRHHRLVIAGFRFVYGLRTVAPLAIGMSDVKSSRFILFNALGALAWSLTIGCFGFLFSTVLHAMLTTLGRYEHLVLVVILATGALIWTGRYVRKRKTVGRV